MNDKIEMKNSKVFTKAEMKALLKRIRGSKEDKTGIFAGRIKIKIKEILNHWFKFKSTLRSIIETKQSPPVIYSTEGKKQTEHNGRTN